MTHPHPALAPRRGCPARPAHRAARRARRGRPQHGRPRARRPAAHHRLRRALPRGPPARRRPDPARLRLHPPTGSATSRRSSSPTATRTTSARCRTCCASGRTSRWSAPSSPWRWSRPSSRSTGSRRTALTVVARASGEPLGPFDCEFVAVNHSIPDALAVAVRTPAGPLLHTGDFKMDQLPLDDRLTDLRAFARLGEEGVDLFMVDSTNAEVPGFTTPSATSARCSTGSSRGRAAGHRGLLLQPRAPGAAGAGRGRRARAQGRAGRPVDAAQHGRRPRPRLPQRARRACWSTARALRQPPRRPGADLHRVAGRADGRAVADGQPRPPDRGRRGRHGRAGLVA